MFLREIELPPFGTLQSKGKSKLWSTNLSIPKLGNNFSVLVRGSVEGPTRLQSEALTILVNNADSIKREVKPLFLDFLKFCGVIPIECQVTFENVWDYLTPNLIEVHKNNEYLLGKGKDGSIAISVGYNIPWDDNHSIHFGLIDGKVDQIYSE